MKICPQCGTPLEDAMKFCTTCGAVTASAAENADEHEAKSNANNRVPFNNPYTQPDGQPSFVPPPTIPAAPYDHTADFDPRDISDNKVIAMLLYLSGTIGIIIALLSQNNSPYVAFHLRQALKILVTTTLVTIVTAAFCWTFIVPIIGAIAIAALLVVKVICFVDICKGKAKEPPIIRSLDFLK